MQPAEMLPTHTWKPTNRYTVGCKCMHRHTQTCRHCTFYSDSSVLFFLFSPLPFCFSMPLLCVSSRLTKLEPVSPCYIPSLTFFLYQKFMWTHMHTYALHTVNRGEALGGSQIPGSCPATLGSWKAEGRYFRRVTTPPQDVAS
jgi:hypothetical protein